MQLYIIITVKYSRILQNPSRSASSSLLALQKIQLGVGESFYTKRKQNLVRTRGIVMRHNTLTFNSWNHSLLEDQA